MSEYLDRPARSVAEIQILREIEILEGKIVLQKNRLSHMLDQLETLYEKFTAINLEDT